MVPALASGGCCPGIAGHMTCKCRKGQQQERGRDVQGKSTFRVCSTSFYKHPCASKAARGALDSNTAQAAPGTFLKGLKAVLGVGQEQLELRSLRKAEMSPCGFFPLPTGVTSVSFHVLIYFNCTLTRDQIMPREQIHKSEHVFLFSADLLIISQLLCSFLAVATCGWRHYPLPVVAAWAEANLLWIQLGSSKCMFGFGCSLCRSRVVNTRKPFADPGSPLGQTTDVGMLQPCGIRHAPLAGETSMDSLRHGAL